MNAKVCALFVGVLMTPALFAEPVISEFLASNQNGFEDENGDTSDWIEIHNPGASSVSLSGWSLTDDVSQPGKWSFPNISLASGQRIIVFASGKDRAVAGSELHTNFSLDEDGEYLALVKPDNSKASEFNPYPEQKQDISYGLSNTNQAVVDSQTALRYLLSVPSNDGQGDTWTEDDYDDATWNNSINPSQTTSGVGLPSAVIGSGGVVTNSITLSGLPNSLTNDIIFRVDIARNSRSRVEIRLTSPEGTTATLFTGLTSTAAQQINVGNFSGENPNGVWTIAMQELNTFFPQSRLDAWSIETTGTPEPAIGGIGYDTSGDYNAFIGTPVPSGTGEAYTRYRFNLADVANISGMTLRTRHDDGFEAYLNGTLIQADNNTNPVGNIESTGPVSVDVSQFISSLKTGDNVLAIRVINTSASSSDLLMMPELILSSSVENYRFSPDPTPGTPNQNQSFLGFVKDTKFVVGRGMFANAFTETISSNTAGATIVYTVNGSEPTLTNGTQVPPVDSNSSPSGGVLIDRTIAIRAAAFKAGFISTNVDTNTYILYSTVKGQSSSLTQSVYQLPSSWGGTSPDYGMDTDIVGPGDLFSGLYANSIANDLKSIPTLSIVMNSDDMFGSNGIYSNPQQSGRTWERATSLELIHPDGSDGFQENCGIRIQGGFFRSLSATRKKSFRVIFRSQYGKGKLSHDFFGGDAVKEFNTIVFRMMSNDSWNFSPTVSDGLFVRDEFGRRVQRGLGQTASHGNWMHLYINGVYWGVYHPVERPDSSFAESYFDVPEDEWDGINSGNATNSSDDPDRAARATAAWNSMISLADDVGSASGQSAKHAAYMKLQGLNSDGSNNASFEDFLDVPNYIDYLIINHYGANRDWPFKNYYCGRHNSPQSTGFKFFSWDYEWTLDYDEGSNVIGRSSVTHNNVDSFDGVAAPYEDLRGSNAFKIQFADRIHRAMFNDGPLAGTAPSDLFTELTDIVRSPLVGESARWGDQHTSNPMTVGNEWENNVTSLLTNWLPNRRDNLLGYYRAAGLYPNTDAPVFNQHGGSIASGFQLTMTNPGGSGTIYYTDNGVDPLQINSDGSFSISGSAQTYTSAVTLTSNVTIMARVLNGGEWSALNAADFTLGETPSVNNLVISEFSYQPGESTAGADDGDDFEFIEIMNVGSQSVDLSSLEFDRGITFDFAALPLNLRTLAAGARAVIVEDASAFQSRYGNSITVLGQWTGKLDNGGETLRLRIRDGATIREFSYDDKVPWPECADGDGFSLTLIAPESIPDHNDPANWRCSVLTDGSPGGSDALLAFAGDPNSDQDNDGLSALLEHFLASSENDNSSGLDRIINGVIEVTDDVLVTKHLTISFRRRLGADDLSHAVEVSTTLEDGSWQTGDSHVVMVSQIHNGDGTVTETWRSVSALSDTQELFMRLKVLQN